MAPSEDLPPRPPPTSPDTNQPEPGEIPVASFSTAPPLPPRPLEVAHAGLRPSQLGAQASTMPAATLQMPPPVPSTATVPQNIGCTSTPRVDAPAGGWGSSGSMVIPMSSAPLSIQFIQDDVLLQSLPRATVADADVVPTMLLPSALPNEPELPPRAPASGAPRPPSSPFEFVPPLDIQQEPILGRKRRASSPRWQTVTRRRRPNNGAPRREAGVGTADRTSATVNPYPLPNAWAARTTALHSDQPGMVASTSRLSPLGPEMPPLRIRTPPPPHLDDEDYLDLAALANLEHGQSDQRGHGLELPAAMDVDPPEVAVPALSTGLGPSHPSTSTLDVPLRHQTTTEPLAHQFHIQTPQQRRDVFYRDPATLPRHAPPAPPIAGPYTTRDVPPRRDPARPDGRRPAMGASPVPQRYYDWPPTQGARRAPLADITEEVTARHDPREEASENAENVPPPYSAVMRPRLEYTQGERDRRATFLDLRPLETEAGAQPSQPQQQLHRGREPSQGPPQGARSLDDSMHAPNAAPRGLALRNPTAPAVRQSMQEPRGGYPLIRFNDHDGHVRGTHPETLADVRASRRPVLAVHFPGVTGIPPGPMVTNVNRRMVAACTEEFGESEVWVVPPRADPNAAPGDYEPRVWFMYGMSPRLADELLRRLCISTHIITFFVFPPNIQPDLVLTLGGFASNIGFQIESMIRSTFEGVAIRNILAQQIAMNPRFDGFSDDSGVEYVLDSIDIEVITVDNTYAANVYLASPASSPANFRLMRQAIEQVPFTNSFNAPAQPVWFDCEICASNDHPTQACRYPTLPGWLGPVPAPPTAPQQPQFGPGSALTYRPNRPSQGTAGGGGNAGNSGGRNGKGRGKGGPSYYMNPGPSYGGRGGGPGPSSGGASGYGRVF